MTSHVYITINLFNLCQQSFLPFYIYFLKCWRRLNERRGFTWKDCLVYVDDVIIWSTDFESHLQHLDLVFQRLRMAHLTLKPNKCEFAKPEILYLGHFISREGITVDPSKIEVVKSFPTPQNQHDVRSFLGLSAIIGNM